jgi:hypothetical protein
VPGLEVLEELELRVTHTGPPTQRVAQEPRLAHGDDEVAAVVSEHYLRRSELLEDVQRR